jgi:hypothetical protein
MVALVVSIGFILACPILGASPLSGDVAVGYSYMHNSYASFPHGLSISTAIRLHRSLFIVLEAARNQRSEDLRPFGLHDQRVESLLAGPRVLASKGIVRPYVETLAGIGRIRNRTRIDEFGRESDEWDPFYDATTFTMQPGVGVDFAPWRRVGFRVAGGLRLRGAVDGRDGSYDFVKEYRFTAGGVYYWGDIAR